MGERLPIGEHAQSSSSVPRTRGGDAMTKKTDGGERGSQNLLEGIKWQGWLKNRDAGWHSHVMNSF